MVAIRTSFSSSLLLRTLCLFFFAPSSLFSYLHFVFICLPLPSFFLSLPHSLFLFPDSYFISNPLYHHWFPISFSTSVRSLSFIHTRLQPTVNLQEPIMSKRLRQTPSPAGSQSQTPSKRHQTTVPVSTTCGPSHTYPSRQTRAQAHAQKGANTFAGTSANSLTSSATSTACKISATSATVVTKTTNTTKVTKAAKSSKAASVPSASTASAANAITKAKAKTQKRRQARRRNENTGTHTHFFLTWTTVA